VSFWNGGKGRALFYALRPPRGWDSPSQRCALRSRYHRDPRPKGRGRRPAGSAVGWAAGHVGAVGSRGLPSPSPKALGGGLSPFFPSLLSLRRALEQSHAPRPRPGNLTGDSSRRIRQIHDRNAVSRRIDRSIRSPPTAYQRPASPLPPLP